MPLRPPPSQATRRLCSEPRLVTSRRCAGWLRQRKARAAAGRERCRSDSKTSALACRPRLVEHLGDVERLRLPEAFAKLACLPPLTHLKRLEAESIHVMRVVAAESKNPVMLYS